MSTLDQLTTASSISGTDLFYTLVGGSLDRKVTGNVIVSSLNIITGSLAAPEWNPGLLPTPLWTGWFRANDLSGADGSAVSSWATAGGTCSATTQATGSNQPTVKAGANGIGGYKVVRFDGTNDNLATTNGGQALSGDFYVAAVVRFNTLTGYQNVLSWGDNASGKRRSLMKYVDTGGNANKIAFIGEGSDLVSSYVAVANTVYFLETRRVSGTTTIYVNGTSVGSGAVSLNTYSSDVMRLGVNVNSGEYLNGDIAEVFAMPSDIQVNTRNLLYGYIQGRYGITLSGQIVPSNYPKQSTSNVLASGSLYDDSTNVYTPSSGLVIGGEQQVLVEEVSSDPATAWTNLSKCAVYGVLACYGSSTDVGNHLFSTSSGGNVLFIWNRNAWSAIAYGDTAGYERGAFGFGKAGNSPFAGPTNGSLFCEASNFSQSGVYGDYRELQTKQGTSLLRKRLRDDTLAIEEYNDGFSEPSASGPTAGLVSLRGLPVAAVANNGTMSTNITTPAYGMIVVKDTTNSKVALYKIQNTTLTAIGTNDAEFTVTADNASTVNVYNSSGQVIIQNKSGGSLNLTASYYGA